MKAALPPDEAERLNSLRSYEILDTLPEQDFDDITLLASQICGTPTAVITLLDENRQWFKSKVGMTEAETSREIAFCAHTILQTDALVVSDACADERFADNPLVTGPANIRFYAGSPLITADGHALGTLCVIDQVPRDFGVDQKIALQALGRQVVAQLELRRSITLLKRKDQEVQESEERFCNAFNHAPIGIALVALDGRWLKVNHALSELLGYPESRMLPSTFPEITHPDDLEIDLAFRKRMVAGEISDYQMEKRYFHESGRIIHALLSVSLVWRKGQPQYFILQIQNITERKQAEETMREKNAILRIAGRITRTGGWSAEVPGSHVFWSDELCDILEYPHGYLPLCAEALALHPQPSKSRVTAAYEACVRDGTPFDLETEILTASGRSSWGRVSGEVERDANGLICRVQGAFQDITERKQAEEKLQRQQSELRVLFDLMPAMIWFKDTGNKILRVNQRVAEAAGKPRSEIEGKPFVEIYPEQTERYYADDLEVIQSGLPKLGYVETFPSIDGSPHWVQTDKVPVRDREGKVTGIVVMAQDITERRRMEVELAYERDLLRNLLDSSPDTIYFKDTQSRFIKSSSAQARQFGVKSVSDLVGTSDHDFFTENYAREAYEDEQEIMRTGVPMINKMEKELWSDGRGESWALTTKMPLRNNEGEIIGTLGITKDITAIKHAEQKLQESRLFLQSTLDALSAHIAILDKHGKIIEVNRAWSLFARKNQCRDANNSIGDNYLEVCDVAAGHFAAEASPVANGIRAVIAGATEEFQMEYPCHSPREQRWFVVRVTRFAGEGVGRVVVAHENITIRKRAEEESQAAHSQLEQLLAHSPAVIYRLKVEGQNVLPLMASENITKMLGFTVAETMIDGWWQEHVHPDDAAAAMAGTAGSLEHGTSRAEFRIRHKDGSYRWVEDNQRLIRDVSGKPMELVGVWTDITERKRIEAQLFQSQKMETVGKLAGGIAHEFNSIMTAIIGQSELLLGDLSKGSPLRKNATEISKAADRAATLTRQLLAYGRKQILQPEILDLNTVLFGMEHVLRHALSVNVDLRIIPAAGLKMVRADSGQIEQVVMNIAMNADDAMPNGGTLAIETANLKIDASNIDEHTGLSAGH